jgi:hypothetical protein
MKNIIRVFLVLAIIALYPTQNSSATQHDGDVHKTADYKLLANLEKVQGEMCILFTITSNSNKEITIHKHNLPWGSRLSLTLVAVELNTNTYLKQKLYIDDPSPTKLTIKPGESISGKISLNKRFYDLDKVLKNKDIIIFWSYQLFNAGTSGNERIGGWFVITKTN